MNPIRAIFIALVIGLGATSFVFAPARAEDETSLAALDKSPSNDLRIRWRRPDLQDWVAEPLAENYHGPELPDAPWTHLARPELFQVAVYDTPEKPRNTIARIRRGDVMPARRADTQRTCTDYGKSGTWWQVPGGFICSASGFTIEETLEPLNPPQRRPAVNMPLPFRYARIITKGAPRWSRLPKERELGACDGTTRDDDKPSGVIECMWDDFFVALDRREQVGNTELFRTVYGEYVRVKDTKLLETPPLRGEKLEAESSLPIAFVYGADDIELKCDTATGLKTCGTADRFSRFRPEGFVARGEERFVRGPEGALIDADHVRVVRTLDRPPGVQPGTKWVHIELGQQYFVANDGDRPVYTSLISSGKPTHATPTGLYQVQRKYLTKIMRGHDPKEGIYHVEEVPWTTYYYGNYAVHGAYWHGTFGAVRSHGCTNLAPADARWLYYWGEPELKPQFHAQVNERATHLYFTKFDD